MYRRNDPKAYKEKRQAIISSLLARDLTQKEILETLSQEKYAQMDILVKGEVAPNPHFVGNPKTGEAVDKATISRDVAAIRKRWQEEAIRNVDELFSEQLAALRELRRANWAKKDLVEVRQTLALEIKLTGTAKPERVEHRMDDNQLEKLMDMKALTDEYLARIASGGS